ncbi:hypothetical protein GL279_09875 [Paracoccus limosus]|jgi:hypothetical protein|uniref:Uncharacterized protein n=1 Tax=Paracoccus limosus TaxID=913252 RepID=A0A844H1Z9_9RHOB|nr:hypothetical protein [Paracoccus limosus]MTH34906.1 hypothetical protein [Paracoccus limosus]
MRRLFLALALIAAGPAGAQEFGAAPPPKVMMCRLQDDSGTGWVPDFLMLTRQTAGPHSGRIEVFDPILQRLVRRPVPASVTADDAAARSYGWALSGVRNQSGQYAARLDYRLTVRKVDGHAWLTVSAQGYENTMQGQGNCMSPQD